VGLFAESEFERPFGGEGAFSRRFRVLGEGPSPIIAKIFKPLAAFDTHWAQARHRGSLSRNTQLCLVMKTGRRLVVSRSASFPFYLWKADYQRC